MIRSHSRRGYSAAQKWLHWGMALLVAILAAVGLTMTRLGEGTVTGALYELHKSIGLIVLALVTARMAVRLARGVPPPEPGVPAWQQRAARASHLVCTASSCWCRSPAGPRPRPAAGPSTCSGPCP